MTITGAAACSVLLGLAIAVAGAGPSQGAATPAVETGGYYLKFDKNPDSQTRSALYLMRSVPGTDKVIRKYRAGSGVTQDTCTLNHGWLPNGRYAIEFHRRDFDGSRINGHVIKIADKRCHDGTKRTALFIHSEMKPDGRQGTAESERWTSSDPDDYYSEGCVKLKPSDIKDLFAAADSRKWPRTLSVVS